MKFFSTVTSFFKDRSDSDLLLKEKRVSPRIRCTIDGEGMHRGRRIRFRIIDISPSGMRIEADDAIKVGERVSIQATFPENGPGNFKGRQAPVTCRGLWNRKRISTETFIVGLRFEKAMADLKIGWLSTMLNNLGYPADVRHKRKVVRAPSSLPIAITMPSGEPSRGIVYNLGIGGLLMMGDHRMEKHMLLMMEIGPYGDFALLQLSGKVLWQKYARDAEKWVSGIEFEFLSRSQSSLLSRYVAELLRKGNMAFK
jgi:hypothetical protein